MIAGEPRRQSTSPPPRALRPAIFLCAIIMIARTPPSLHAASASVVLEPDPQAQRLLDEARREPSDIAVPILAQLADGSPDRLVTLDSVHLIPIHRAIERILLDKEHEQLLAAYRRACDPVARGILERAPQPPGDAVYQRIAERYFLTTPGDEAAFAVACSLMDRYEFEPAAAIFARLIHAYPDSSLDRHALLARWLVAACRTGQIELARDIAARLPQQGPDDDPLLKAARAELQAAEARASATMRERDAARKPWRIPTTWQAQPLAEPRPLLSPLVGTTPHTKVRTRAELLATWRENDLPARHQLTFRGELALFRSHTTTTCISLDTGKTRWQAADVISPDRQLGSLASVPLYRRLGDPRRFEERFLFGDPLANQVAVIDDMAIAIEGQGALGVLDAINYHRFARKRSIYATAMVFHDIDTGRLLARLGHCRLPASDEQTRKEETPFDNAKFLCLPAADSHRLFLVTRNRHMLWLHAIDRASLRSDKASEPVIQWSRLIGPEAFLSPGTGQPVDIAIRHGVVYLATGLRAIIAFHADTGRPLWTTRYQSTDNPVPKGVTIPAQEEFRPVGWSTNRLFVTPDYVVAAPPDTRRLIILDRWTGQTIAQPEPFGIGSHRLRMQQLIHADNHTAWVIAHGQLAAVDLKSGKTAWRSDTPARCGQPIIHHGLALIPAGEGSTSAIHIHDLHDKGKRISQHPAPLPDDSAIMSLHRHDQDLYAWTLDTLHRLQPAENPAPLKAPR